MISDKLRGAAGEWAENQGAPLRCLSLVRNLGRHSRPTSSIRAQVSAIVAKIGAADRLAQWNGPKRAKGRAYKRWRRSWLGWGADTGHIDLLRRGLDHRRETAAGFAR